MVSFTQKQNVICSQTQLSDIAHEQTITCRSRGGLLTNERKTNLPRRLIYCIHTETYLLKSYVVNFHTQISWHKYLTRALSMKFSTLGHIHNFLLLLSSFFFSSAKSRFRLILQNNQISQ